MTNAFSSLTSRCEALFRKLSAFCGWLLLALVILQFSVVIGRYLLGINFLWAQELALYLHASIFLLGSGWTLLQNRHVSIDIFYNKMGAGGHKLVGRFGMFLLLVPAMMTVLIYSSGYALESWSVLEGSREISGLPGVFLVKTLIPLFALLMLIAGCISALKSDE